MVDSLFDNRYRYDYIYPRGRSGETLRAVDTSAGNRPVVIKRPAPNDAPPIRAGQEVSILNERKALARLSGHPVLTALLDTGQFSVGGTPHQYIVMERAEGLIIADHLIELGARGETLPELELLVIADHLLDLLEAAHERDIVYNDVDAKHLFWDREHYRLKVIDWGNAVFLEGDEITPQGISRQSDIAQVGELLYAILTGGRRADIPRDAGENFMLDFGDEGERIARRLQTIVSKAAHPNPRLRYPTIAALRKDLGDYRAPIQRERDIILGRVSDRLRQERSRDELNGLLQTLEQGLAMDPGYPTSRELHDEIQTRLQEIEVSANLDAIRIYLDNNNWSRTANLLDEQRQQARGDTAMLINLLLDMTVTLMDHQVQQATEPIQTSFALLFEGSPVQAGQVLVAGVDDQSRHIQWLLAERISAHIAEVQLLRPNLYRLEYALAQLADEGVPVSEPQAVIAEINATLNAIATTRTLTISDLRDNYRAVVDGLTALQTLLDAVNAGRDLPNRKLPFSSLERASNAAMALADNMHVIGRQAAASPRDATSALANSRAIDPGNACWDMVGRRLDGLYELLGTYQTYVPAADGADLDGWLLDTRADLEPFVEYLFDEMLVGMAEGVEIAHKAWSNYANATIQGNRLSAVTALNQATDAVGTISPTLAGWFNQLRIVINSAHYVERHALYGGLGRALADGWEAFDRGRLADAEQLGQRAFEIAQSDPQRFAADRLRRLAEITRNWLDRSGINTPEMTKAAVVSVERLFTVDENETRENFTSQMPTKDTYLKAMSKGLIELYAQRSTAAIRILFMNYVLLGVLDAHEGELEDATFWYEAATKTLEGYAERHLATRALGEFITRRSDILSAAETLNEVNGSHALPNLEQVIKQLTENPQARLLAAGVHSLHELQAALRDWSDGEFRPAGIKLENAINAINEIEKAAGVTLTHYRAWLIELQSVTAELHTRAHALHKLIDSRPARPTPPLQDIHQEQYQRTAQMIGPEYAETLRAWHETYEKFLSVYTDLSVRRSIRLERFNELFRAMFIDRHPAYSLYRHWYDLTEQSPEFPAPPTDEPTPQIDDAAPLAAGELRESPYDEVLETSRRPGSGIPRVAILGGLAGIALIVVILIMVNAPATPGAAVPVTITDTPTADPNASPTSASVAAVVDSTTDATEDSASTLSDFATPTLRATEPPVTSTDTPAPVTATPADTATLPPSATFTPTSTASDTPTATPTPTPTLPPAGLQGRQDLLTLFQQLDSYPWNTEQFSIGTDGTFWRLGIGTAIEDELILISLPPEMLELYYGNNAASRIRRMEVTLTLTTFNPPLLLDQAVYFGALLQDAARPGTTAGLQVQLVQPGLINLGQRSGDNVRTLSQRTVNAAAVRARLDRDPNTGAITVFFNDEQLGEPISLAAANAPLIPVLYVKAGGVIVSVTDWRVTLN